MAITDIQTIRVDDIPLLMGIMSEMGIQEGIDNQVQPHGLWQGISVGTIVVIWLSYILTTQDHRLEPVQRWVNERQKLFNRLLGIKLRETDLTDDRLANVLTMLGKEETQALIDEQWNQKWVTLYELPTKVTRYDSTTVSVYQDVPEGEEGILGYGFSKDHRPDLAQFKVMLSSLGIGLPLTCQVVNGKRADDGLYVPAYESVVETLGHANFLGVGDSKMAAWETRKQFVLGGSWYLCPYRGSAARGEGVESWIETALQQQDKLCEVHRLDKRTGEIDTIARVHEWCREQSCLDEEGNQVQWQERVLVSHSLALQKGMVTRRQRSEQKLFQALEKLKRPPQRGLKRYRTEAELRQQVEKLLKKHHMSGIVAVDLMGEPHKDKGERWTVASYQRLPAAWQRMVDRLGWGIYLCNAPTEQYTTAQLIHTYRKQPNLERSISRLKSRYLNIRPLFLHDPQRIVGLTWLLILALRVMMLTEFQARRQLAQQKESIRGLKAGSPNTATQVPTAEKLFKAFEGVNWTIVEMGDVQHFHIAPLNDTQCHILRLLNLPDDLYSRFADPNPKPLFNLRE